MAKSKLKVITRPRPEIAIGDVVEIGEPQTGAPNYFGCVMVVQAIDGDIFTCSIRLPDGRCETMSLHRDGIVGCFREIDLNY